MTLADVGFCTKGDGGVKQHHTGEHSTCNTGLVSRTLTGCGLAEKSEEVKGCYGFSQTRSTFTILTDNVA